MYDLAVMGGGIGGYPAAVTAAKAGLKVVLFEEVFLGGECANYGCIPSKALLHYALVAHEARRLGIVGGLPEGALHKALDFAIRSASEERGGLEALLSRVGVNVVREHAVLRGCDANRCRVEAGDRVFEARRVLVATGSQPAWPSWAERCERILDNRGLFSRGLPDGADHIAVIGGGVAGVEISLALARLGASVTIFEALERLLPGLPESLSRIASRMLRRERVETRVSTPVSRVKCRDDHVVVCAGGECREYDAALVLIGRRPRLDAVQNTLGARLERDEKLRLRGNPNVYLVGDAAGPPFLAHKALMESLTVAADILGWGWWRRPRVYPQVIYTDPELVDVTLEDGEGVRSIRYYWGFAAPARIRGHPAQLVYAEIGYRTDNGRIVYVRLAGPHASELAAEATLIIERGLTLRDVAGVTHPHPSASEAILEAVLEALGAGYHRA
ncbi:dihydrolipoyl dehydrogenase family protein [Pyrolobus fumarii]|uniref:dihydrolipoyl dehydrogenase family protein n=1 Tax=Pyrolobus fumarii TaxID=54252 RepID=UPI001FCBDD7D|nr:NAD(P)/FAD-dependent oxidoreductase [Pyrolobus fumarii]